MTAPEGPDILSGVTRSLVLDLARREGLKIIEQHPLLEDLYAASEVLLTGTTVEVLPSGTDRWKAGGVGGARSNQSIVDESV